MRFHDSHHISFQSFTCQSYVCDSVILFIFSQFWQRKPGRRKANRRCQVLWVPPQIEWSSQLARRKIAGHQKLVIFFMIESIKLCTGLPYAHNDFVFDLVRLFVRVLSSHSNVAWEKIEENWTDLFHLSKTQSNHSQSMSLTLWIFDEQIFDRKLPLPKCFTYS